MRASTESSTESYGLLFDPDWYMSFGKMLLGTGATYDYMDIGLPILIIIVILFWAFDDVDKDITVKIEAGLSTTQIADVLKENDVIESKLIFLATVNFSEYKGKLKYGEFEFNEGDGYFDVIKKLAQNGAKKETITITIPEGYSV